MLKKGFQVLTVSQLNRYVKSVLEENGKLASLLLQGEISNFNRHFSSGHFYFTLKDDTASIKAVMFKSYAGSLPFLPENGMEVVVRASAKLYERDGTFQVYVTDLMPSGEGAQAAALRQKKERLEKLGVFDPSRKKTLPAFPSIIGVITSQSGAAAADILQVLERRSPMVSVLFCPALVQGKDAPESLIAALQTLDKKCDLIIIGRGGGADEDLEAFQDEGLALQVHACSVPVISAVGHEVDMTICDLAADLRAPTPSAAAELAAPSMDALRENNHAMQRLLQAYAMQAVEGRKSRLEHLLAGSMIKNPGEFIKIHVQRLSFLEKSLYNRKNELFSHLTSRLQNNAGLLDSLSPLAVLKRGYSLVEKDGKPASFPMLHPGDHVNILFHDGMAGAIVDKIGKDALDGTGTDL